MQQANLQVIKQRTKKLLPKLKCAFHQTETLTNFCSCPKCLLPLCPTCIKIHTIEHVNMKTDPSYENLHEMIVGLNVQVKEFTKVFEDNHRVFTEVQQKIIQFKEEVFANIDNLKRSMIDEVDRYFTQLLLSTEQKISQIKYIQDLAMHKSELKKTILLLKRFEKNLNDQNCTGKFVIRNLIKYSSKNTDEYLDKYDSQCKEFLSKVQGNFCTFSLKDNLKNSLMDFLGQAFKITICQIPTLSDKDTEEMASISTKLQQFTAQNKGSQKSDIKNSLTKVMSKANNNNTVSNSSSKYLGSSQTAQLSYEKKSKQMKPDISEISKKIFESGNKRTITNHSSQRKSMHISRSFGENEGSVLNVSDRQNHWQQNQENSKYNSREGNNERRSTSKGKGLSLIQARYSIGDNESRSLTTTQQIRFSLAEIQNVNFQLDTSKSPFASSTYNKRR